MSKSCRANTRNLERVAGIEPASSAWKAEVLPLNYTRVSLGLRLNLVEGEGFEPSKSMTSDLQSDPFGRSGTPPERGGIFIANLLTVKHFLIKNLRLASLTVPSSSPFEGQLLSGRHSM